MRKQEVRITNTNVARSQKIRTKKMIVFFAILISVLGILKTVLGVNGLTSPVYAQDENGISLQVTPPVSYLHVAPGAAVTHTIILENNGTTEITVMPTISDFTTDGETGRAIVTNELSFPYISLGQDNAVTEVLIPPGKKAQLTLSITVPKEAEEKEYPLTILFFSRTSVQTTQPTTHSQVSAAIGSNLVVLVAKQNVFSKVLSILDITAPSIIDSFQNISFTPVVKNESLGAVAASGSAKIVNWRKQTVTEFEIYPDVILAHNTRELRALLSSANPKKPEVTSFSYHPRFLIGPYQIIVTLTNEQGIVITQSIHVFYALPIAFVVVVLIGVALTLIASKIKPRSIPL